MTGDPGLNVTHRYQDSSCQTGDYKLVTEDGRHWVVRCLGSDDRTGEPKAQLRDHRIYP